MKRRPGHLNSYRRQAKVRLLMCERPWVECHYCGCRIDTSTATLDHIVPQSQGGTHSVANLLLACKPCNAKKGATPYQKYIKRIAA